ncbi:MAG: hypothetical protein L6R39_001531 [Caloplaca ligustica]|nr:MAG: hypothetical protein L6R39_001531 [Caloplaca ligustica]
MAPTYRIAVIQLHPKPMRIEANYAKAAQFIQDAANKGAQLAVLPEYHLTNWVPDDPKFSDLCGQWENYLNKYRALAQKHNICLVPGTIVERHQDEETGEDKLINVAYFIDNKGEILGRYQKKNLWHPERPYLTSSTHSPHDVIETPIGPVGLLICWDLAFPEAFRELITAGAKIIIIPTFWTLSDCSEYGLSVNPRSEALFLESTITSRAFENTCAVVFVNAGGPAGSSSSNYAGLSRVAVPFLGALGEETKDSGEEGMSIVDLDMRHVEEAEANYKVRQDLAREDWYYVYRDRTMTGREKL